MLTFATTEVFAYGYHRAIHLTDAHWQHHAQPENMRALSHLSLLSGAFVLTLSHCLRAGSFPVLYWFAVTSAHPILHKYRFQSWPMSYVQKRHDIHHEHGNVNFGPITPFMDMACGTEAVV